MRATTIGSHAASHVRGALCYVRQFAIHPTHALVPLVSAVVLFVGLGIIGLLSTLLVVEIIALALVPQLPPVRRYFDAQLDRKYAEATREALVAQMSEAHKRELERLESIVERIRRSLTPRGIEPDRGEDFLGLARLLAAYTRLAVAVKAGNDCLSWTNRGLLEQDLDALTRARETSTTEALPLVEQRLSITRARIRRWDRSAAELGALTHQLAAIVELVNLIQEQCFAPVACRAVGSDVEACFESMRDNEATIRELTSLLADDATIDPKIFITRIDTASAANDCQLPRAYS